MSITKWSVGSWVDKPTENKYAKETAHFYVLENGRRNSKISRYNRFFDTETEALEFIAARNARYARSKEIDQIKRHAVELIEAAERYLDFMHTGHIGMSWEYSGIHPETQLKEVIAKAKGVAQ